MNMRRAALAYARTLGFHVFPVGQNCRQPMTKHGYRDATRDPRIIIEWWTRHPENNLAVATGVKSGVWVLDIDVKPEANGEASLRKLTSWHGDLPPTWEARTPSGGRHLFWSAANGAPASNRVGLKIDDPFSPGGSRSFHGLDVRTDGGSAALAPSRKPKGSYEWIRKPSEVSLAAAPSWLMAIAAPPPPPPINPAQYGQAREKYVQAVLDGELSDLEATPAGQGRNHRLFRAAARLGEFVGAGRLDRDQIAAELRAAADRIGLTKEDGAHSVECTIKSGLRRGARNA